MSIIGWNKLKRFIRSKYCLRLIYIIVGLSCFQLGYYLQQRIPISIVTHPAKTWQTMKSCPIGSKVSLINVPFSEPLISSSKANSKQGIVIGYSEITYKGEFFLLCKVQTYDENGKDISFDVNPLWFNTKIESTK